MCDVQQRLHAKTLKHRGLLDIQSNASGIGGKKPSNASWTWTPELGSVARNCFEGIGSTKLVEDGVRTQRYGETSRNQAHRLSDTRAYWELIQKETATNLHKWPEPAYTTSSTPEGGENS
eukprot:4014169-Amphidinium_carterae.2